MADATVTVEIGFASDPGIAVGSTTWTDVTDYVDQVNVRRGRQQELEQFRAGTCSVQLKDPDGRFNPANTSGPYYPNVKPMRRLRVRATDPDTSTVWTVFSGFIDRWPQSWLLAAEMPVTVEATDGFKLFAGIDLPDSVYEYEVSESAPVHWWRLSETSGSEAADYGSSPADGTYSGVELGASSLVEHDSRSAVTFDGSDKVTMASGASIGSAEFTFEFVMQSSTSASSFIAVIYQQGWEDGKYVQIFHGTNGTVGARVDDRTALTTVRTVTDVTDGQPHHIAVVGTASSFKIFVDGVDDSDVVPGSFAQAVASPYVQLGASPLFDTDTEQYIGTLQHFASYDTALSDATIARHGTAVTSAWFADTSGERVGRVLDVAGWPAADRDLDTGQTTFGDADLNDDQTVLQYLQRAERSESGHLFVTGDGRVRFIGRHDLITETVYSTSQVTVSDDPAAGEYVYSQLEPDYDDDFVNEVTVQRKFGIEQTVVDVASQDEYLVRSLSQTGLLMDSDSEALSRAQWLLNRLKEPRIEINRIDLEPEFETGLWAHVLGLDLMSRVTVERTPHPSGDTFVQESHIQGIEHTIRPPNSSQPQWTTSWFLSPADAIDYLILDDATYGQLDTNALAY